MGEVESAQDHLNTALAMLAGLEHAHTEAFTILLAGGTPFMTPYPIDLDKSLAYCRQALAVATRGHLAYFQTISQFYVSFVQAQMAIAADRPDKAEILQETTAQMENCLQVETQIGSQLGTSSRYIELASLYGHLGEMETAFQLLDQAVEIINTNQEHYFAPELYQVKGDLCLAQNDPAAAERCYQQALNIARQQSADWWVLKVGRSLSAGIHDLRQPGQGVRDGGGHNGPGLPGQPGQVEA
jgi:tetratricopeptide (TPR) repeat protein